MTKFLGWTVFLGVISLRTIMGIEILRFAMLPGTSGSDIDAKLATLTAFQAIMIGWTSSIAQFLAPVIQFALVIVILLYAAQRIFGTQTEGRIIPITNVMEGINVQAVIAITVIAAFSVAALTGVGSHITDLKD